MNRAPGINACTQIPRQIFQPGPVPFRSLFSDCYAAIRGLCEDEPEGLTVVAVGPGGIDWSRDLGNQWSSADTVSYWAVAFASPGAGWAVGPGGRITRLALR